jgi:hypothetical protein
MKHLTKEELGRLVGDYLAGFLKIKDYERTI